jgi:hypothetical protein
VEFLCFLPQLSGFLLGIRRCTGDDSKPILRFACLLPTNADSMAKVLLRHSIICLTVVGANGSCRPNQLADQRQRDRVARQSLRKGYDRLTELGCAFFKIIHLLLVPAGLAGRSAWYFVLRHSSCPHPSCFVLRHSSFLRPSSFELRHSSCPHPSCFVLRHSSFLRPSSFELRHSHANTLHPMVVRIQHVDLPAAVAGQGPGIE